MKIVPVSDKRFSSSFNCNDRVRCRMASCVSTLRVRFCNSNKFAQDICLQNFGWTFPVLQSETWDLGLYSCNVNIADTINIVLNFNGDRSDRLTLYVKWTFTKTQAYVVCIYPHLPLGSKLQFYSRTSMRKINLLQSYGPCFVFIKHGEPMSTEQ